MRIEVDTSKCVASGACVMESPRVFDQDDDGTVVVLAEHPSPELESSARRAAALCPASAIFVRDDELGSAS